MTVSTKDNIFLHKKLPIDQDETILGVWRHHWFAYATIWLTGAFVIISLLAVTIGLLSFDSIIGSHRPEVLAGVLFFCVLVAVGTYVPVAVRSKELLVLTEESLMQILQPSLFASKIDQVALQRIDDISVRQDFIGTILGYGHLSIETPGEQDNYEFSMIVGAHEAARVISQAKENLEAALEAGRMPTTLGTPQPNQINPQQYQEFLEFEQMKAQQAAQGQVNAQPPSEGVPQQPVSPVPPQENEGN